MTKPNEIAPTRGVNGNSYEWILDVGLLPATPGDPIDWLNLPDMTALAPNSSPTTTDGGTYANKGQANNITTGEAFTLNVNAKLVYDADGNPIPALSMLIEAANALLDQDRAGDRVLAFRYYHYKVPNLAYEFTADVTWTRANTGNTDLEFIAVTLTAKGDRKVIANPALAGALVASLVSAAPTAAAEGEIVRVVGENLKGTTAAKIGDDIAAFVLVGGTAVYLTVPAGEAGSAPIVLTVNGTETAPLAYTRGA